MFGGHFNTKTLNERTRWIRSVGKNIQYSRSICLKWPRKQVRAEQSYSRTLPPLTNNKQQVRCQIELDRMSKCLKEWLLEMGMMTSSRIFCVEAKSRMRWLGWTMIPGSPTIWKHADKGSKFILFVLVLKGNFAFSLTFRILSKKSSFLRRIVFLREQKSIHLIAMYIFWKV